MLKRRDKMTRGVKPEKNDNARIKYVQWKDIWACFVFLLIAPIALIAKIFVHDFWLVGEEKSEARDNGYWFFKYVREQHPEQKIAYVIDKKCSDYEKVKNLGKVIQWGGIKHWFWYLTAKKNISSQKGCKPNAAACYLFEVKLRLWRNKRYFLQHGVIVNDLEWLYYNQCYFKLFCCSAKPEYDFVSTQFGYPSGIVELVGLTRFDALCDEHEIKREILVMPTWRENLVRPYGKKDASALRAEFPKSRYFRAWSDFLCSDSLRTMLKEHGYTLLFYPHRNMQCYLDFFRELRLDKNIRIVDPTTLSVQQALKQAACLITDYSSVFFDFAYMKKPIVFYQFDETEFRNNQYKAGYFDYHENVLGKWSGTLEQCLMCLEEKLLKGCPINDHVSDFFDLYDNNNCERVYAAVVSH